MRALSMPDLLAPLTWLRQRCQTGYMSARREVAVEDKNAERIGDRRLPLEPSDEVPAGASGGYSCDTEVRPRTGSRSRAIWSVADQVVSSATNAVLSFLVARSVSASAFGAFAVAFTLYSLSVGLGRATATAPLGIRYSRCADRDLRQAAIAATGSSLALGLVAGGVLVVFSLLLFGQLRASLLAMGIVLPALLTQDSWRYVFFAAGRPMSAAANDMIWAAVQFIAVGGVLTSGVRTVAPLIFAWGGSAAVAAMVGLAQAKLIPDPRRALPWSRQHWDLARYMGAEYVTVQGSAQAAMLLIGGIGGIGVVGSLRAAQVILGPTTILAVGMISFAIPEFSWRRDLTPHGRMRASTALSAFVVLTGVGWASAILLLPASVGQALLGESWKGAHGVLMGSIVFQAGSAMSLGPAAMLYALGRARSTFKVHALLAPLVVICSVAGVYLAGAQGAAWGQAMAAWAVVPAWFLRLRSGARGGYIESVAPVGEGKQ
jgi:O-antigen/teichoic acid export membrane protein